MRQHKKFEASDMAPFRKLTMSVIFSHLLTVSKEQTSLRLLKRRVLTRVYIYFRTIRALILRYIE
jgi:hypothetical protein